MNFENPLVSGVLIKRYKRFFADVKVKDQLITAHCPNTGSMMGLLSKNSKVWISKSNNEKRKLKYTLQVIEENGKKVCCFLDHEVGGNEDVDTNLLAVARGADLVIWDGMFLDSELASKKGWGHSSIEQGVYFAEKSGCNKIAIAHHAPNRTDEQLKELENNLPSDSMFFAAEKMNIII